MSNFMPLVPSVVFHGDWTRPGPRLVFVHGFGLSQDFFGSLGQYSPFIEWSARVPLLTIDLPAHGRTPGLRDNQGHPTMSASCLAVDSATRISRAMQNHSSISSPLILFGHSLGGTVCLHLADLLPNVAELVLADPFIALDLDRISQQAVRQESILLAGRHPDPEVIMAIRRQVFADFAPRELLLDSANPHLEQLRSVARKWPTTLGYGLRNCPGQFQYGDSNPILIGECGALLSESAYVELGNIVRTTYVSPNPDIGHFAMVFDRFEDWSRCLMTKLP